MTPRKAKNNRTQRKSKKPTFKSKITPKSLQEFIYETVCCASFCTNWFGITYIDISQDWISAIIDFLEFQPEIPYVSLKNFCAEPNILMNLAHLVAIQQTKIEKIKFTNVQCISNEFRLAAFSEILKGNNHLEAIKLARNNIGSLDSLDDLAFGFSANNFIERVTLKANFIPDKIAPPLLQALLSNTYLRKLNLSTNKLGLESAKIIAQNLSNPVTNLVSLKLADNEIGDEGTVFICDSLHKNTTLQLLFFLFCFTIVYDILCVLNLETRNQKYAIFSSHF